MRNMFFLFATLLLTSFQIRNNIIVEKEEAQKAFVFLNDIRTNPTKYYEEFSFIKTLKINNTKLSWNDTLAKVAEAKALDMATRNYFDHIDPDGFGVNHFISKSGYKLNPLWTKNREENYFESITAEADNGESSIRTFVIDEGIRRLDIENTCLG